MITEAEKLLNEQDKKKGDDFKELLQRRKVHGYSYDPNKDPNIENKLTEADVLHILDNEHQPMTQKEVQFLKERTTKKQEETNQNGDTVEPKLEKTNNNSDVNSKFNKTRGNLF